MCDVPVEQSLEKQRMKAPWACKVWNSMDDTPESFWEGLEDFRKLGAKGSELLWKAYLYQLVDPTVKLQFGGQCHEWDVVSRRDGQEGVVLRRDRSDGLLEFMGCRSCTHDVPAWRRPRKESGPGKGKGAKKKILKKPCKRPAAMGVGKGHK